MSALPLEVAYQRSFMARAALALPHVRLFRRNTGLIKMSDGRFFRASIPGQCDLFGIDKSSRHYEIEIKRFTKLSPEQVVWRDWCWKWPVPWLLLEVRKGELPSVTVERWVSELQELVDAPTAASAPL